MDDNPGVYGENEGSNYKKMSEWLEEEKESRFIIGRDFNVRTADDGGRFNEDGKQEVRDSIDKVKNAEGKEMIQWLKENGIGIINGK